MIISKYKNFNNYTPALNFKKLNSTFSYIKPLAFDTVSFKGTKTNSEEEFQRQSELFPNTAFLYNPNLTLSQKKETIAQKPELITCSELCEQLNKVLKDKGPNGVNSLHIKHWVEEGKLTVHSLSDKKGTSNSRTYSVDIVDTDEEKNKEFLTDLFEKAPHCIAGDVLWLKYNFSMEKIASMLRKQEIVPLYSDYKFNRGFRSLLFDLENETNRNTISNHLKLVPRRSERYFKSPELKCCYVPIAYLSKCGFGSARELYTLVKEGKLKGASKKTKDGTKTITYVDIVKEEIPLQNLRSKNKNVLLIEELASKLHISKKELTQSLLDGELEIIPVYIFSIDSKSSYIDLTLDKNKAFVERKAKEVSQE